MIVVHENELIIIFFVLISELPNLCLVFILLEKQEKKCIYIKYIIYIAISIQ